MNGNIRPMIEGQRVDGRESLVDGIREGWEKRRGFGGAISGIPRDAELPEIEPKPPRIRL